MPLVAEVVRNLGENSLSPVPPSSASGKVKRDRTADVELTMSVPRKLGIAFLFVITVAASCFQEVTLAADSAQNSSAIHARITRAQAEKAALARVPGGKLKGAQLERENGRLIWSIDVITPLTKKVAAVQVDAHSGQVLSKLVQNPADRAEESGGGKKQTK